MIIIIINATSIATMTARLYLIIVLSGTIQVGPRPRQLARVVEANVGVS